ncbi:tRNA preQ1(34) S-adenosylmethionine ribosyltransferase-isomerase QueA [Patescibacteria group bacterium]|nr:tRNA preQ1(34) S-adenosylmethionine ribosyltransferase-isomerase QueA [Patescibacteria group bacterium]
MDLNAYDYYLPESSLALSPATPRDLSKLFIYNTAEDSISFDRFYNLDKYLPTNSFLVLNNTKVLPARATLKKESGGKIVLLFLVNEIERIDEVKVMADRRLEVGNKVFFESGESLEVISQDENLFVLKYGFGKDSLFSLLQKYGAMPIPPYLKKSPLKRDELMEKYQTIFAKKDGSSAAPTASLHFTKRVFDKLDKKGIDRYFVTLHVGLGTFAPLTDENMRTKRLHEEYYEVNGETILSIQRQKSAEKKLVAVGTTVVRTLESLSKLKIQNEKLKIVGKTDLFIFPPYNFRTVDCLITNFHLPKSSLMMLVEAFLQYKGAKRKITELYEEAIKNNFRFYSFGDAMVIK